ncbi:MAG: bifunctional diaminohydroxyphosphoribosylaminopyrimidine deaminase/5-amino-6-(5-phosphoribosylamino)uracil reductase RibD [Gammaproteobacteria bacterium]|nr:bifunctional diaminohydroxyphosphoribosylaminopyrimidine deaminase/5-amino-6-(5-phosphoribosylamino)uracil reductase RibD [Gammaproteobacteria bacterium]MDH5304188.1 bifunctional diaminohydroxyphosphoribosylaminopyrimidine deaminase/5-amino-6-(5-phosphoribosylamino)uracil reductase RibD [Gammaproteobacteria bacterium]
MPDFTDSDSAFMQRAVELARNGLFSAHPNPMVGCVLVKQGKIVAEGWHEVAGEAHAEIRALAAAGDNARGATAYVTLEPCAHHGRTPPCTAALIAAGIREVVVACGDPNPRVDGKGMQALRDAGIAVRTGVLREQVEQLLAGFFCRMLRGRPRVRIKIACSLDGAIAMADGQSQWITGAEARADGQRLRASSGAVMTGIGTVLADDPSLTVRDASLIPHGRQPLRVIVDSELRMPLAAEMLVLPGTTLVYCCDDSRAGALRAAGAEVARVSGKSGLVDLVAVLADLGKRDVNDLLVEAGPSLAGQLLLQGLVDELVIYQAPHIMGSETMRMFNTPGWSQLMQRQRLQIVDRTEFGDDLRITARPVS